MKPCSITISAFGSYADEVTIPFEQEGIGEGIFLITGDTGAGKTTIFDAITYALYGECSGRKRSGEMMRSQFAKDTQKTFVEYVFIYKNQKYTIKRWPKQSRRSRRKKDGVYPVISENEKVELIFENGSVFKGRKQETDKKIIEIIGLNVNQFTQVAMLAQGDFLQLLHASSKDRKAIFTRIFDTGIYAQIEEHLRQKFKESEKRAEENQKEIQDIIKGIQCIADSQYRKEYYTIQESACTEIEKILAVIENLMEELEEKEKEIEKAYQKNQEKQERIKQAEEINGLFYKLNSEYRIREDLQQKKQDIEQTNTIIQNANKALQVKEIEMLCSSKESEWARLKQQMEETKQWIEEHQIYLKQKQDCMEQAVFLYKERYPVLWSEIERLRNSLSQYQELDTKRMLQTEQERRQQKIQWQIDTLAANMEKLTQEQKNLAQQKETYQAVYDQLAVIMEQLNYQQKKQKDLKDLQQLLHDANARQQEYEQMLAVCTEDRRKQQKAKQYYEELYQKFMKNQAGYIAESLTEGSPCPVCGSTCHPHKAPLLEDIVTQQQLNQAKKGSDKAEKKLHEAEEQLQSYRQAYEAAKALVNHIGQETISANFSYETANVKQLIQELSKVDASVSQLTINEITAKKAKEQLRLNEKEQEALQIQLENGYLQKEEYRLEQIQIEKQLAEIKTEIQELEQKLEYATKEDAKKRLQAVEKEEAQLEEGQEAAKEEYQSLLNQMHQKQGNLNIQQENDKYLAEEVQKIRNILQIRLQEQGFANIDAYCLALRTKDELEQLGEKCQQYREAVLLNQERIQIYEERTRNHQIVPAEKLNTQKELARQERKELDMQSKELFTIRQANQKSYHQLQQNDKERGQILENYTLLKRLSDTANGNLSNKHINFQTYMQRRYFKVIIAQANRRLLKMSHGQFCLECRNLEAMSGRAESGLELDVYDLMNSRRRDVKTLSGGESFMAALAMALGMADVIQNTAGSISIDTVFIDEGFGSLSEDTREQAIAILNELSGGRRLVGIISHVTELKNQIETKLIVSKDKNGSTVRWEKG